jgi:hypothetical protein
MWRLYRVHLAAPPPPAAEQQPPKPDSISSLDGTCDGQTTRPRKPIIKSIKDPRQRILKKQQKPEVDEELGNILENQGATLVSYSEHIPESDEVVSSEKLKYRRD